MFNAKIQKNIDQLVSGSVRILRKLIQLFHRFLLDTDRKGLVTVLSLQGLLFYNEFFSHSKSPQKIFYLDRCYKYML